MSDLRPDLTQEERALWDAIMVREQKYIGPDDECPYSKVDWWAEKCIRARRRLFAPPASEEKVTCPNCNEPSEDVAWLIEHPSDPRYGRESWYSGKDGFTLDSLLAIRYARKEDAVREIDRFPVKLAQVLIATEHMWLDDTHKPPTQMKPRLGFDCPNCGEEVLHPWSHFPGGWRCPTLPAQPEPAATEMPEAAVDDDMPEQVSDAVRKLNRQGRYTATAHRLVAWFRASFPRVPCSVCSWPTNSDGSCARCSSRNSSQPVTPPLAMTPELESVLAFAIDCSDEDGQIRHLVAAVRAQATAPKVR